MSGLSTHVLDTATGRPATGVPGLLPGPLTAGTHRLVFATGEWFKSQGVAGFYPEVTVVFDIQDPGAHHHVPLLLSPFGYSTYRGS
jgi:5-hydroxyisourate hydrolase